MERQLLIDKIDDAIESIDKRSYGLAYDYLRTIHVGTHPHAKLPSAMAVTDSLGRNSIFISDKLVEDFTEYELQRMILHELFHLLLDHNSSETDLAKKYATDRSTANTAMDAVINEMLTIGPKDIKLVHPIFKGAVTFDTIREITGVIVGLNTHTVEAIFDLLLEVEERKGPSEKGSNDMGASSLEGLPHDLKELIEKMFPSENKGEGASEESEEAEKSEGGDTPEERVYEGASPEEQKEALDILSEQLGKGYSKEGSSLEIQATRSKIKELRANRNILKHVRKLMKRVKIHKKNTIKRRSRRFPTLPLGKTRGVGQRVLLAVDVSGSMSQSLITGNTHRVIQSCVSFDMQLDILWGDTKLLGRVENIGRDFDVTKIRGGGGTNLRFMFKNLEPYSSIICITDGDFDHSWLTQEQKEASIFLIVKGWGEKPIVGALNLDAATGEKIDEMDKASRPITNTDVDDLMW